MLACSMECTGKWGSLQCNAWRGKHPVAVFQRCGGSGLGGRGCVCWSESYNTYLDLRPAADSTPSYRWAICLWTADLSPAALHNTTDALWPCQLKDREEKRNATSIIYFFLSVSCFVKFVSFFTQQFLELNWICRFFHFNGEACISVPIESLNEIIINICIIFHWKSEKCLDLFLYYLFGTNDLTNEMHTNKIHSFEV